MHDVLEGALQYEIKLMLQLFIFQERYLTLAEVNGRIQNLDLGYMESKDRPTLLNDANIRAHSGSSKNSIKQSGKSSHLFYLHSHTIACRYIKVHYIRIQ